MKVRILSIFTAGAVVLGVAGLMAPAASAGRSPQFVHHGMAKAAPHGVAGLLYSQNDNDAGVGLPSQNFETMFDAYDAQLADDFRVRSGHTWMIKNVTVTGVYYSGYGPARSETVYIYTDAGGLPGARIGRRTTRGTDTRGSFSITFGRRIKVPAGANWVSVRVNMDFSVGGQWAWETRSVQSGKPASWRNPGDGFGTGCKRWGVMTTCIPSGEGPDLMFSLGGQPR
jgi:hypothetical protein